MFLKLSKDDLNILKTISKNKPNGEVRYNLYKKLKQNLYNDLHKYKRFYN